jgi:hypothetical protein
MLKLLSALSLSFTSTAMAASPGYDIVIVAGQSNAVGVGCGPYTDVSKDYDDRIDMVYPGGDVWSAEEPLEHAPANGGAAGKGFAMTFARLYAAKLQSNRKALLVPVALGGTSILQWDDQVDSSLDFHTPTNGGDPRGRDSRELIDTLTRQTRIALRTGGFGSQNRIVALLWHQGETDMLFMSLTNDPIHRAMPDVATYGHKFVELVQLVRKNFPNQSFPIVAGELGRFFEPSFPGANGLTAFNSQLAKSARGLKNVAVVSSQNLGNGIDAHCAFWPIEGMPQGDPVHFNAASQVEFGKRYYATFRGMLSRPKSR